MNRGGLMTKHSIGNSFAILILCFLFLTPAIISAQTPAETVVQEYDGTDLILVIDTSKSMRGVGSSHNIFWDVIRTCKQLTDELLDINDTVTIISYDSEVTVFPTVTILTATELLRLKDIIDNLEAEGDWTYTSLALAKALDEAYRLESNFPNHRKVIVIFTDGLNDPPPGLSERGPSFAEVTSPYAGKPWFVLQVQLSSKLDVDLAESIDEFPNSVVIHEPDFTGVIPPINEVVEEVIHEPLIVFWQPAFSSEVLLLLSSEQPVVSDTVILTPSVSFDLDELVIQQRDSYPFDEVLQLQHISEHVDSSLVLIFTAALISDDIYESFPCTLFIDGFENDSLILENYFIPLQIQVEEIEPECLVWTLSETEDLFIAVDEVDSTYLHEVTLLLSGIYDFQSLSFSLSGDSLPDDLFFDYEIVPQGDSLLSLIVTTCGQSQLENETYSLNLFIEGYESDSIIVESIVIPIIIETTLAPVIWPYILVGSILFVVLLVGFSMLTRELRQRRLFGSISYYHEADKDDVQRLKFEGKGRKYILTVTAPGEATSIDIASFKVEKNIKSDERLVTVYTLQSKDDLDKLTIDERRRSRSNLFNHDDFTIGKWTFHYRGLVSTRR